MNAGIVVRLAMMIATSSICGCGGDSREKEREDIDTVFDPLTETLDRAEAVQDVGLEHKEAMDESMRRMEEGADDNGGD